MPLQFGIHCVSFCIPACLSPISAKIGTGWCHDENNVPSCGFDGGDCCGPDVKTSSCSDCECLGENIASRAAPGPFCSCSVHGALDCKLLICFIEKCLKQATFYFIFQGCEFPEMVNNDVCNDQVNTAECNYDGGNQWVHSLSGHFS